VLVITYDEWGGFFDHVRPPRFADGFRATATEDHGQAGFRVPTYVVSPFARRRAVAHQVFDHTSILKLVEWRWGLKPLSPRDAGAGNLAEALDFRTPNRRPASVPEVADPGPHVCGTPDLGMSAEEPFWRELAESPLTQGWI
jgi:phospholipase C